jgi:hypothetical protein
MENHASTSTAATQIKLIAQMLFFVSAWSRGSCAALRLFAFELMPSLPLSVFDPLPFPFLPFFFFFAIM